MPRQRLYTSPSGQKAFVDVGNIPWLLKQSVEAQDDWLNWQRNGGDEAEA